jgi:hypothetical protein
MVEITYTVGTVYDAMCSYQREEDYKPRMEAVVEKLADNGITIKDIDRMYKTFRCYPKRMSKTEIKEMEQKILKVANPLITYDGLMNALDYARLKKPIPKYREIPPNEEPTKHDSIARAAKGLREILN